MVDNCRKPCLWTCLACDETTKWAGMPPDCACGVEGSWVQSEAEPGGPAGSSVRADQLASQQPARLRTGARELDALLNGGVAEGSSVLLYGSRGTGKSRLTYRMASAHRCLVVHPEMAQEIARFIAESTGANLARLHLQRDLSGWREEAQRVRARTVVLDSLGAADDAVAELRAAQRWAQDQRAAVYCIAHATKAGDHRGSSELAHWADYEWQLHPDDGGARLDVVKTRLEPCGSVVLPLA